MTLLTGRLARFDGGRARERLTALELIVASPPKPHFLFPKVLSRPPPVDSPPYVSLPQSISNTQNRIKALLNYGDAAPTQLTEEEEDLTDALSPIYDQLAARLYWWILEIIPLRHKVQMEDNYWISEY